MWMIFKEHQAEPQRLFEPLLKAGFESVALPHQQTILRTLDLLDNVSQTGFSHFKQRQRIRKKLHKIPKGKLTTPQIQQLKNLLAQSRELTLTQKYSQLLDSSTFWAEQFDAVRNHRKTYHRVLKLSGQWVAEGRYARYSTIDLLSVYQTVLPLFANWLHFADQEFKLKAHRLNALLVTEYTHFLQILSKELHMEERNIRTALRDHLAVFYQRRLSAHPVLAMVARLGELVGRPFDLPETACLDLTPNQSNQITHLIETEGDVDEIAALHALPRYPDVPISQASGELHLDAKLPYRKNHAGHLYQLPLPVTPYIPLEPPFYIRLPRFLWGLFPGAQVRYQFFQHPRCQFLLTMSIERETLPADTAVVNLMTTPFWQFTSKRLAYLMKEKQRAQHQRDTLNAFFHPDACQVLQAYDHWLQQEAKHVLSQQIQQLTVYIETRAHTQPLTQVDNIQLKELLDALEAHHHVWGNPLPLECTQLRTLLKETPGLPDSALPTFIQKPVEQMTIFERFYTDLLKLIQDYERTTPLRLPEDEQHLQRLKTILKEHEKEQDAIQLQQAVVAYNIQMASTHPISRFFTRFFSTDSTLTERLEALLNKKDYQETALYAHERVARAQALKKQCLALDNMEKQLTLSTETVLPKLPVASSPTPIFDMAQLAWINNPLEKEADALKKDFTLLLNYQTQPHVFKYQALGYLYYFVRALSDLPSKAAFEAKLPIFRLAIAELTCLEQRYSLGLEGFLRTLRTAEQNLSKPMFRDRWTFFVKNHFQIIGDIVHRKYLMPTSQKGASPALWHSPSGTQYTAPSSAEMPQPTTPFSQPRH